MIKILIFSILFISFQCVSPSTDLASQNDANRPVTHLMENLAVHTNNVTNELLAQLAAKIERLAKTLAGNIEVVVTSALHQLAQPFEDALKIINSPECQTALSYEELKRRVNNDLSNCTQNLNLILHTFEEDTNAFNAALEQNVQEIIDLPKECQNVTNETDFGSNVSCYVEKITKINQQIAVVFNNATSTLLHTRQLGEQAVEAARSCAENVVVSTIDYLNKILDNCQAIEN